MIEPPFNYAAAEALLRSKREAVVKAGTRLDRRFLGWCRESGFSGTEILSLFPKVVAGQPGPRYVCDVQCPKCQNWRVEELGVSAVRHLVSWVKNPKPPQYEFRFQCTACEAAAEAERRNFDASRSREELLARMKAEAAEKRKQRAEVVVTQFLSPRNHWRDDIAPQERFQILTCEEFNNDVVAAAIRRMEWSDFFKTPYWIAVHGEALRRIRQRCVVCAEVTPLRVHYRTNDLHGLEHTEKGMRELLFLCKHCEITFPLKSKSESN
jgi:hypothetical protein